MTEKTILVTGGAGFIGSNFVLEWVTQSENINQLGQSAHCPCSGSPAHHCPR